MSDFEQNIKNWVSIDNELKKINEHARDLRAKRAEINDNIIRYVESQNLDQATIQISDGQLRFAPTKHTACLTFKHVEACLHHCLNNTDHVKNIMKYIKDSRESTHMLDIKRIYQNSEQYTKE